MKTLINKIFLILIILILASCLGKDKHVHHDAENVAGEEAGNTTYTCPMHPQIVESEPGSCPICGMNLEPVTKQVASKENEFSLMLSDNQIKLGNITTRPVQTGQVGNNIIFTGRLISNETQADVISSRASGRIEKLFVKETGKLIRKGQPLYELYSESLLTLEQEYLLALDQVKAFPGQKQFISILEAAERKLQLVGLTNAQINKIANSHQLDARITFLAPTSGVVTEIAGAEGLYVAEGSMLYRLNRFSAIWVEAELYPQEANQMQVGTPIEVRIAGTTEPIKTKISFINPEFRQNSQVVVARAEIPNPKGRFIAGTQATISSPGATNQVIILPLDAVIRDSRGAHVWLQTAKNTFSPKMVTLGEESANQVAIASGLSAKDTVVVTGAYLLHSESILKNGADQMDSHSHLK